MQDESHDTIAQYRALTTGAGLADFSRRTQIELQGEDAAAFLHNLCTNDIRRLAPGSGCETFLCNAQGHVLAFVYVFRGEESLVLETTPDQESILVAHLDRYLIREKVELIARSAEWGELLLAGPQADDVLRRMGTPTSDPGLYAHWQAEIEGVRVSVRRVDFTLPGGYLLSCHRSAVEALRNRLLAAGVRACAPAAVEPARIEAFTPLYGVDITDKNLPQEVARDARAISFTKGCYIGQETVARIDALGHVNRTLVGVRFEGDAVPTSGTELSAEGKIVGQVTSAAYSPKVNAPLALAYVRRGHNQLDSELHSPQCRAMVVALPI